MSIKYDYKRTKAQVLSVQNSNGFIFKVGQRFYFNVDKSYCYIKEIRIVTTIIGGEFRLVIAEQGTHEVTANFDIEYALQFLTTA